MKFALYELATGRILSILQCPLASAQASRGPGQEVVEVGDGVLDTTHYVSGDSPRAMPAKPGVHHRFDWVTKQWRDPRNAAQALEDQWSLVRRQRDALLAETDWVVLRGMEDGRPLEPGWRQYRTALRGITSQADPFNIVWPQKPEIQTHSRPA
jgi:hypothetical protein